MSLRPLGIRAPSAIEQGQGAGILIRNGSAVDANYIVTKGALQGKNLDGITGPIDLAVYNVPLATTGFINLKTAGDQGINLKQAGRTFRPEKILLRMPVGSPAAASGYAVGSFYSKTSKGGVRLFDPASINLGLLDQTNPTLPIEVVLSLPQEYSWNTIFYHGDTLSVADCFVTVSFVAQYFA